jgi:hypothetical protein
MGNKVEVKATYVRNQPIITTIEANLDPNEVIFQREEYAVKAIFPISLLIKATSVYLFEKVILDPMIDPVAEKFNWVEATKKLLKPHQPFNITIHISDNDFISAPINLDHKLLSHIWQYIKETLEILKDERILEQVSKIRITSSSPGEPSIILYQEAKPWRKVSLEEKKTTDIPND